MAAKNITRVSKERKEELIKAWKESGLTAEQFQAENKSEIKYASYLSQWQNAGKPKSKGSKAKRLLPLVLAHRATHTYESLEEVQEWITEKLQELKAKRKKELQAQAKELQAQALALQEQAKEL